MFPSEETGSVWNWKKDDANETENRMTGFFSCPLIQRFEFVERTSDIECPPGDEDRHRTPQ